MLRCRLLGHRFRFAADGATMQWRCERGCGAGGEKRYATAAEAGRYARGFERERSSAERRTPLGALPLRLWRAARGAGEDSRRDRGARGSR
jgi:hypothetical protein